LGIADDGAWIATAGLDNRELSLSVGRGSVQSIIFSGVVRFSDYANRKIDHMTERYVIKDRKIGDLQLIAVLFESDLNCLSTRSNIELTENLT
jgi:hypothetical protein